MGGNSLATNNVDKNSDYKLNKIDCEECGL